MIQHVKRGVNDPECETRNLMCVCWCILWITFRVQLPNSRGRGLPSDMWPEKPYFKIGTLEKQDLSLQRRSSEHRIECAISDERIDSQCVFWTWFGCPASCRVFSARTIRHTHQRSQIVFFSYFISLLFFLKIGSCGRAPARW